MKKIIFLEGLPGVGKTTIVNTIKSLEKENVFVVDEVIKEDIINRISEYEEDYMINDEMKISKYNEGLIIIDRGPISTLSYNQTRAIIDHDFDAKPVVDWFKRVKDIYDGACIIYLTTNKKKYKLSYDNVMDPFGAYDNQALMEEVSLYNCHKYCDDVKVIEYHQDNMEEIINEIIG